VAPLRPLQSEGGFRPGNRASCRLRYTLPVRYKVDTYTGPCREGFAYLATAHRTLPAVYLCHVLQGDIQGSAPVVVSEEVLALARDHDCVLVEISAAGLGSDTLPVR